MRHLALLTVFLIFFLTIFLSNHQETEKKSMTKLSEPKDLVQTNFINSPLVDVVGDLDRKVYIRKDVKSWITSRKLNRQLTFLLTNIAIVDESTLVNYATTDETKVSKILKETDLRVFCLMNSSKEKAKTAKLLSELRQQSFNSKDRITAFDVFLVKSNKVEKLGFELVQLGHLCEKYKTDSFNIVF